MKKTLKNKSLQRSWSLISDGEKNVRELEYEYKTIKSEVIFRSKASELLKVVEPLGLKEVKEPPMVLNDTLQSKP